MDDTYFESSYRDFKKSLIGLVEQYLKSHLVNKLAKPIDYAMDVQAFCIFAHAAMEYLLESWAIAYCEFIVDEWEKGSYEGFSSSLMSLCLFYGRVPSSIYDRKKWPDLKTVMKLNVPNAAEALKSYASDRNHGINTQHIRKLFWPLGIDFEDTIKANSSLETLRSKRGQYAHRLDRSKPYAPEDARNMVLDCDRLAETLSVALTLYAFPKRALLVKARFVSLLDVRRISLSSRGTPSANSSENTAHKSKCKKSSG